MAKGKKGSKENPVTSIDLQNLANNIPLRSFAITKASIKDDFCNYTYEVTEGIGLGDSHAVKGAGIIKDELRHAFGALHVHMAVLDESFKHSGIEIENIEQEQAHELTGLYAVESFEVKDKKGAPHVSFKGSKYSSTAGGWFTIVTPEVPMDNLSGYKWYNELKTAVENVREEVAKYREGNYVPVIEEEVEDKNQGNLFAAGAEGQDETIDADFENAEV